MLREECDSSLPPMSSSSSSQHNPRYVCRNFLIQGKNYMPPLIIAACLRVYIFEAMKNLNNSYLFTHTWKKHTWTRCDDQFLFLFQKIPECISVDIPWRKRIKKWKIDGTKEKEVLVLFFKAMARGWIGGIINKSGHSEWELSLAVAMKYKTTSIYQISSDIFFYFWWDDFRKEKKSNFDWVFIMMVDTQRRLTLISCKIY